MLNFTRNRASKYSLFFVRTRTRTFSILRSDLITNNLHDCGTICLFVKYPQFKHRSERAFHENGRSVMSPQPFPSYGKLVAENGKEYYIRKHDGNISFEIGREKRPLDDATYFNLEQEACADFLGHRQARILHQKPTQKQNPCGRRRSGSRPVQPKTHQSDMHYDSQNPVLLPASR